MEQLKSLQSAGQGTAFERRELVRKRALEREDPCESVAKSLIKYELLGSTSRVSDSVGLDGA